MASLLLACKNALDFCIFFSSQNSFILTVCILSKECYAIDRHNFFFLSYLYAFSFTLLVFFFLARLSSTLNRSSKFCLGLVLILKEQFLLFPCWGSGFLYINLSWSTFFISSVCYFLMIKECWILSIFVKLDKNLIDVVILF